MRKRESQQNIFSSALLELGIVPEERRVVLVVAEPRYLTQYHENLTEAVKGFTVQFLRFSTTWEHNETEPIDSYELSHWLTSTIEPLAEKEVIRSLKNLLRSFPLWSEIKDGKVTVSTSSGLENFRKGGKSVWCLLSFDIEIQVPFAQPKPKYEALHIANSLFEFIYRRIHDLLVNATERVLTQQNVQCENVLNGPPVREHYSVDLSFTEGGKTEEMDFPMRWIFNLRFSEEEFPSQETFTSLFEGVARDLQQNLAGGITTLLIVLRMIPPGRISYYEEDSYLREPFHEVNIPKLLVSRGSDINAHVASFIGSPTTGYHTEYLNFLFGTLEELKEVLAEMGV